MELLHDKRMRRRHLRRWRTDGRRRFYVTVRGHAVGRRRRTGAPAEHGRLAQGFWVRDETVTPRTVRAHHSLLAASGRRSDGRNDFLTGNRPAIATAGAVRSSFSRHRHSFDDDQSSPSFARPVLKHQNVATRKKATDARRLRTHVGWEEGSGFPGIIVTYSEKAKRRTTTGPAMQPRTQESCRVVVESCFDRYGARVITRIVTERRARVIVSQRTQCDNILVYDDGGR